MNVGANLGFHGRYATRSLAREGSRSLLAILCVAVGVMAVVALQLVANMVNVGLTGNIRGLNGGDIAVTGARIPVGELAFFEQLQQAGTLATYTAVTATSGAAQGRHPVARIDRILSVDPATFPLAGAPAVEAPSSGSLASLLTGTSVVLTVDLARQLGVAAGDSMTLTLAEGRPATVTVGGIIANSGLFAAPQILLARATYLALRSATAPPLSYDEVFVDVPGHSPARASAVQQQLHSRFPQADVITTTNLLRSNQEQVQGIRSFLQVVGLVALLIGGMGILNTMQVLLHRRRMEVALLKTVGYRRGNLIALFGAEALLIGLAGGLAGAGLGIAGAFVVKRFVEQAFSLALPTQIDLATVGAGVALGAATALIFGLLPILQASQVRPQAVLRDQPEGARTASRLSTLLPGLLLAALFFVLAESILRNTLLALELVVGAGAVLGLLGGLFLLLIFLVSHLPVATLLPRAWKTHLRLALRNFGRSRARTATTEVALFTSVFAVGLILVLGQGLKDQYAKPGNAWNATLGVVDSADYATVAPQLAHTAGVTRQESFRISGYQIVAINGAAVQSGGGMEGYDLAHGQLPAPPDITLDRGRLLGSGDAGTRNVMLASGNLDPALHFALGDRITVQFMGKFTGVPANSLALTLTVVGFYTDNRVFAEREGNLLADDTVLTQLAGDKAEYSIALHLDPARADAVLTQFVAAYPGAVWVHNYADLLSQVAAYFNNIMLALEAVVVPALLAAIIIIADAVALAMLERRREQGILKAVGYTSRGILAQTLIEQGIAGVLAGLLAMGCSALAALALARISFQVEIGVSLLVVAAVVLGSAALCVAIGAGVAWSAARVRPLEVLRYE